MERRDEIIQLLDQPFKEEQYNAIKLVLEEGVDDWFYGVIGSLYYKPNNHVLVLEGWSASLFKFMMKLTPHDSWNALGDEDYLYNSMFCAVEFTKKLLPLPMRDEFIIIERPGEYPTTNKRLTSYYTITHKWTYPQRKNYHVVSFGENDIPNLDIDPLDLWREIFYNYHKKLSQNGK